MRELGLDTREVAAFFEALDGNQYLLFRVPDERVPEIGAALGAAVRRCYVSDEALGQAHHATSISKRELVQAKLPNKGSTMSGDFGEIFTAILQSVREVPAELLDPKKLRLKQDRTKPAPHSDVVQFIVPEWPTPTSNDRVLCAEVKTKATRGATSPILEAITDSKKDQDARLLRTLLWLKERALFEALGSVDVVHINRFIEAIDHPAAKRQFYAVAVISSELVDAEVAKLNADEAGDSTIMVISVPRLKATYEAVYEAALQSAETSGPA